MKILVAEDDVMLADCLAEFLKDEGHDVCGVAETVADAVTLARAHHPDLAILDMNMRRGERGSDIADQLAASGDLGHTGILYVTGSADQVYQHARFGHALLSKPCSMKALAAAMTIVQDIAITGSSQSPMPRGLRLLHLAAA